MNLLEALMFPRILKTMPALWFSICRLCSNHIYGTDEGLGENILVYMCKKHTYIGLLECKRYVHLKGYIAHLCIHVVSHLVPPAQHCKYRVSQKKRNLFGLEYLKDDFVKLIVLLVCYTVLSYNSVEPNFGFLQSL